jgi:hypothetical protein
VFLAVVAGWVIFRSPDLGKASAMLWNMGGLASAGEQSTLPGATSPWQMAIANHAAGVCERRAHDKTLDSNAKAELPSGDAARNIAVRLPVAHADVVPPERSGSIHLFSVLNCFESALRAPLGAGAEVVAATASRRGDCRSRSPTAHSRGRQILSQSSGQFRVQIRVAFHQILIGTLG